MAEGEGGGKEEGADGVASLPSNLENARPLASLYPHPTLVLNPTLGITVYPTTLEVRRYF